MVLFGLSVRRRKNGRSMEMGNIYQRVSVSAQPQGVGRKQVLETAF